MAQENKVLMHQKLNNENFMLSMTLVFSGKKYLIGSVLLDIKNNEVLETATVEFDDISVAINAMRDQVWPMWSDYLEG